VRTHLERGRAGAVDDTPQAIGPHVHNRVIGNNQTALDAAARRARALGYHVFNLGAYIEGETRQVATAMAGLLRSVRADGVPIGPPACILSGGETTVTLSADHGRGGRNQEFVLAVLAKLGEAGLRDAVVLSGGTDGEDGPTDAAGAVADAEVCRRAAAQHLDPRAYLARNDAYPFFAATDGLVVTGLTQTNVMDVRLMLAR
jgi:glycerate-2-kinase